MRTYSTRKRILVTGGADFTGAVNLCNSGEFTILELAKKVNSLTGSRSEITFKPLHSDDPTQRESDIALARRLLGCPPVRLNGRLPRAIDYFRKLVV